MSYRNYITIVLAIVGFAGFGQDKKPVIEIEKKDTLTVKDVRKKNPQYIQNVVKTNPLPIIWGHVPFTSEYKLLFEFTTAARQSSEIGISYYGMGPFLKSALQDTSTQNYNFAMNGFRITGAHRFYIRDLSLMMSTLGFPDYEYSPLGMYIGPMASYSSAILKLQSSSPNTQYIRFNQFNVQMMLGYQFDMMETLTFDVSLGMGYKRNQILETLNSTTVRPVPLDDFPYYGWPVKFTLSTYIGYCF